MNFEPLEARLGYQFNDRTRLLSALTHSSWTFEHQEATWPHQERLEFLGDAVLELAISQALYNHKDQLPEGEMTRMRQLVVREETLSELAESLDVGSNLLLGHGELITGGAAKTSNLEDAMEAIFAAIYLDSDLETAASVIVRLLRPWIDKAFQGLLVYDYKSRLLEKIQEHDKTPEISWELIDTQGPAHARVFTVAFLYNGQRLGQGEGRTKKSAEQAAAKTALENILK